MTNLPIELAKAREARTQAWNEYMQVIDRPHTSAEFHEALTKAGQANMVADRWYHRWQMVGGTSDIESIVDAETFLNAVETCLVDAAHDALAPKVARFMDEMAQHGYAYNSDRFQKENEARKELHKEYNKLFK